MVPRNTKGGGSSVNRSSRLQPRATMKENYDDFFGGGGKLVNKHYVHFNYIKISKALKILTAQCLTVVTNEVSDQEIIHSTRILNMEDLA